MGVGPRRARQGDRNRLSESWTRQRVPLRAGNPLPLTAARQLQAVFQRPVFVGGSAAVIDCGLGRRLKNILAIAGSLRALSINAAFCRAAARLAPAGMRVSIFDDLGALPLFNPDLEAQPPAEVT